MAGGAALVLGGGARAPCRLLQRDSVGSPMALARAERTVKGDADPAAPLPPLPLQALASHSEAKAGAAGGTWGRIAVKSGDVHSVLVMVKTLTIALPAPEAGAALSVPPKGGERTYTPLVRPALRAAAAVSPAVYMRPPVEEGRGGEE